MNKKKEGLTDSPSAGFLIDATITVIHPFVECLEVLLVRRTVAVTPSVVGPDVIGAPLLARLLRRHV